MSARRVRRLAEQVGSRIVARARGARSSCLDVVAALRARPRHRTSGRKSAAPAVLASLGLALPLLGVIFALNAGSSTKLPASYSTTIPGSRIEQALGSGVQLSLPAATTAPAPSPPVLSSRPNLPPHQVFGFAPYWALAQSQGFDVRDLSTVDYFSLDVNGDGSIVQSGPGWVGYESQDLVDLINRAHAAEDRVVLTVTCFDQGSLNQLSANPAADGQRLATELTSLLAQKSFDGVNIDFEGNGPQDRAGLDELVSQVSSHLRAANPHWQITMDTYASSAGDQSGFFDIGGLAPSVDGFFVMAYDMYNASAPSPNAPLVGSGNTDTTALEQYESLVPASKVVLGVPAYGYDWPTSGQAIGSPATGSPTPVTYAQIASMNTPVYWDPRSETPWTAYQAGAQWHQIFFDNPTSIALKARLAEQAHAAGVGLWALGMDGGNAAIYQALLGSAHAAKYRTGPTQPAASPGVTPGAQASAGPSGGGSPSSGGGGGASGSASPYQYSGTWNGHNETLQPVNPSTLPGGGKGTNAGQLTGFSTNDPSAQCLSQGPALSVTELSAAPSDYVVTASKPTDCTNGTWMFQAAPSTGAGSTPGTTAPSSPVTIPGVFSSSGAAGSGSGNKSSLP